MSTQNIYDLNDLENSTDDIVDINPVRSQTTEANQVPHHFYQTVNQNHSTQNFSDQSNQTDQSNQILNQGENTKNLQTSKPQDVFQKSIPTYPSPAYEPDALNEPVKKYSNTRSNNLSSINLFKAFVYFIIPISIFGSLYVKHILGILVFWIISLIAVKLQPKLALIIALITTLFIVITYPIFNYVTLIGLGLLIFSSLFLGLNPTFSKFNKFITASIAILIGLWITVPMSQVGSIKYLQNQYSTNLIFKTTADSLYIGAGSPKLSPSGIEKNFKSQISSEIANSIKDKTKLIPAESQKILELCKQLGSEQNLNENCNNLDKENINKNIDTAVTSQVDQQTEDLKKQFNDYPQVQMVQNLLNGLANNNSSFLSSPYFIPSIVLLLIYAALSSILQLISWPIIIILKKVALV